MEARSAQLNACDAKTQEYNPALDPSIQTFIKLVVAEEKTATEKANKLNLDGKHIAPIKWLIDKFIVWEPQIVAGTLIGTTCRGVKIPDSFVKELINYFQKNHLLNPALAFIPTMHPFRDLSASHSFMTIIVHSSDPDRLTTYVKENFESIGPEKINILLGMSCANERLHPLSVWILNNFVITILPLTHRDYINSALQVKINKDLVLHLAKVGCIFTIHDLELLLTRKRPEIIQDLLIQSARVIEKETLGDFLCALMLDRKYPEIVSLIVEKRPDAARWAQKQLPSGPLHLAVWNGHLHHPNYEFPQDMKLITTLCEEAMVDLNRLNHVLNAGDKSAMTLAAEIPPPYVAAEYFVNKLVHRITPVNLASMIATLADAKNDKADEIIATAFQKKPEIHDAKWHDAKRLTAVLEREANRPKPNLEFIATLCKVGAKPNHAIVTKLGNDSLTKLYLEHNVSKLSPDEAKQLFDEYLIKKQFGLAAILAKKRTEIREAKSTATILMTTLKKYVSDEKDPNLDTVRDLCKLVPFDPMKKDKEGRILFSDMLDAKKFKVAEILVEQHYPKMTVDHMAEAYLKKYAEAEKLGIELSSQIRQLRPDLKRAYNQTSITTKLSQIQLLAKQTIYKENPKGSRPVTDKDERDGPSGFVAGKL